MDLAKMTRTIPKNHFDITTESRYITTESVVHSVS